MRASRTIMIVFAASAAFIVRPAPLRSQAAKSSGSDSLSGRVSSTEEPVMEGVLVTAKKENSTISYTVVSDQQGHYRFPSGLLEPGHYALKIRAAGYDLAGPASMDITAGKKASADLTLRKTADLAAQLTSSDWLASFPGTPEQKELVYGCTHCHTLERIARTHYNAEQMLSVIERMGRHTAESFPLSIQQDGPPSVPGMKSSAEQVAKAQVDRKKLAEYLATVNLSKTETWQYPLKTAPRPTGKATQVLITQYDLPKRTRQPHDVVVDSDGNAWYASFGESVLGKLDPKTGKTTEYQMPVPKPGHIIGNLDLTFDEEQNLWIAMTYQAAVAKFDTKTEKFTIYKIPAELDADYRLLTFAAGNHQEVDGKVWVTDSGSFTVLRIDTATGKWETFEPFPKPRLNVYEVTSDPQNNAWFNVIGRHDIGRIDAKTGEISIYPLPTPNAQPRRGALDAQGRLWVGENLGNKIAMFDTKTHEAQEWTVPDPTFFPYSATSDKYGYGWAVTEFSDSVARVDSRTGQFTTYLMPIETNGRRAFVEDPGTQVKFWVGSTHGAAILKVEPLDGPAVANAAMK